MGAYAPDHVQADVRTLALQGYRAPTISQKTNVPETTVRRWLEEWRELASEQDRELFDQERRIALLTAHIYEEKLEAVARGDEQINVTQAGVNYGISRSKLHERAQRSQPQVNVGVYVFTQAPSELSAEQPSEQPTKRTQQIAEHPDVQIELSRSAGEIKDTEA